MEQQRYRGLIAVVLLLLASFNLASAKTYHRVQKSETFYSISKKYGVSVGKIMSANGVKDPRFLKVGQKLLVPGKSVTPTKAKVTKKTYRALKKKAAPKKSMTVILDPGHGGRDKGAIWGGVRESDLNLRVAYRAMSALKSKGYRVIMTRYSDRYVSLSGRARIANQYKNAIFVSIHFNATRHTYVRGAETFYAGRKGRYLASAIQRNLVRNLSVRNRGVRYKRYAVLRLTHCPAVLVECGFISNAYERARCKTSKYQARAAAAIVRGVERYDRVY